MTVGSSLIMGREREGGAVFHECLFRCCILGSLYAIRKITLISNFINIDELDEFLSNIDNN